MITILHRGGRAKWLTVLHKGRVYRDSQKWLRNFLDKCFPDWPSVAQLSSQWKFMPLQDRGWEYRWRHVTVGSPCKQTAATPPGGLSHKQLAGMQSTKTFGVQFGFYTAKQLIFLLQFWIFWEANICCLKNGPNATWRLLWETLSCNEGPGEASPTKIIKVCLEAFWDRKIIEEHSVIWDHGLQHRVTQSQGQDTRTSHEYIA